MSTVGQRLASQPCQQATVAVDATGLAAGAISTFFVKWDKDREPGFTWRHWLKWTMAVDVDRQVILAQTARPGPTNDCAVLRPLLGRANQHMSIGLVFADAEFDRECNHLYIRHVVQAQSVIPAKWGAATWHILRNTSPDAASLSRTPLPAALAH